MTRVSLYILVLLILCSNTKAQEQVHPQSTKYEWPTDPAVKEKLETWRDQKFGMIIHWGLYAVPGMIESWSLCSEDWVSRDTNSNYGDYKNWYWGLKKDFNQMHYSFFATSSIIFCITGCDAILSSF